MLGQRLAQLRKRNGWSQARLASAIGKRYDRSMIAHVEAGRVKLQFDGLVKAALALDVSIDYLAGLTEDPTPADDRSPSTSSDLQRVPLREPVNVEKWSSDVKSVPAIGHLLFRREWLRTHGVAPDGCSVVEMPDASMEPEIQAGAWILVDHNRTRRQGNSVFAVQVGNHLSVKRAVYSDDDWLLVGDNPKCKTLRWPDNAMVLGRVAWAGKVL